MPAEITRHLNTEIYLTINEKDVKDALLILQSYSCQNYSVTNGCSCSEEVSKKIVCNVEHNQTLVSISANCETDYIPSLVEELRSALGNEIDVVLRKVSSD
mgnify:CR=1 FL=1